MNVLKNFHPACVFLYFFYIIFISIFSFDPIILCVGFLGVVLYCLLITEKRALIKSLLIYFIIFLAVAVTNPLFSHNGKTVLFFINDNRVTLEAFIYGAVLGIAIVEVILWFKAFNLVFDSERIIFLFGKISPKLALVFSMTLRFIPSFIKSFKEINKTQKLLSGNKRINRYLLSFSAVITSAMENSIITSDSMKSRGYGLKKRTCYSRFKITLSDIVFMIFSTLMFIISVVWRTGYVYYPSFVFPELGVYNTLGYTAFFVLAFTPFIIEAKEGIRWKYSISKI